MNNPWDSIFLDKFEEAYQIANDNYVKSSVDFDLRARAICALLLNQHDKALKDFLALHEIEKRTNRVGDGTYLFIALCYYALNDNEKAVEYFKFPVTNEKDMKYTSDITLPPSILHYIAVKMERQDLLKLSIKGLKKLKQVIPSFLLGNASEADLDELHEQQTHETLRIRKQCKVEFYKAVKSLQNDNVDQYVEHLKSCVDLKGKYMEFEYFLARLDYGRLNSR